MTLLDQETTWETVTKLCSDMDPSIFFPELEWTQQEKDRHMAEAKRICEMCPAREMCLERNLDERFGVVGGTTPDERMRSGRMSDGYQACGICGTIFMMARPGHKYCSQNCRRQARVMTQRRYEERHGIKDSPSQQQRNAYNARRREQRRLAKEAEARRS